MGGADASTLSDAVVEAVADYLGIDETDVGEPLYDVINTDSLDDLFRGGSGEVSFRYTGLRVTVDSDGNVAVREPGRDESTTPPE